MTTRGKVVVLGSGAGGSGAARALAAAGWDVTVVERDVVGGTCLWRGCMPKKALATSAKVLREVFGSEQFGVLPGEFGFDWPGVLAWKWHSQETYAGDQEAIMADRGIRLVKGDARFTGERTVAVSGQSEVTLEFDQAVIATGSEPIDPPIPGVELGDSSTDALRYSSVPSSLLIVGGGFIGLEFAGIYASFGSQVTIVSAGPRPLEMADPDAAEVAVRHLERLGVSFNSNCRMKSLSGEPGAITAQFTDADGTQHSGEYERALLAIGRRPAVSGLDLDAAGVELDEHDRIVHDAFMRTTNPAVWVVGDAAGGMMQTPVASYEGRTVAGSIETGTLVVPDCSAVPTTVFTVPPIAQVGLTEAQATEQGIAYTTSVSSFEYSGAAIIDDDRDGLVKFLFAEEGDRLIGAHIAGRTAPDLIWGAAVALKMRATRSDLAATLGIHPAYSEVMNWTAM